MCNTRPKKVYATAVVYRYPTDSPRSNDGTVLSLKVDPWYASAGMVTQELYVRANEIDAGLISATVVGLLT